MKAATVGSTPDGDRKKDRFSGLPSLGLHLCMHEDLIFGACLAVVYTARTKILAHVKYPTPTFRQAEVKPNGRWHGNVEMMCCGSRIIILKECSCGITNGTRAGFASCHSNMTAIVGNLQKTPFPFYCSTPQLTGHPGRL